VLGVVNFTRFHDAMASAQHIVTLGPTAVELVDRTMVELALANPAFKPTMQTALIGRPGHPAGGVRRRRPRRAAGAAAAPGRADGRPGHARQRGRDARRTRAEGLWEVRKAGLNIMMSLKGDGKPVSFIEDCAVPLQHLAAYTDALTEVFTRATARAAPGTRTRRWARCTCGPSWTCGPTAPQKMRAIAEEAAVLVRRYKGAYSGEHGDGLCRGEWIEWQFGPALNDAFRAIKPSSTRPGCSTPARSSTRRRWTTARCSASRRPARRPYKRIELKPVLDWSAWNVKADPVTEVTTAPGTGGDTTGGLAKAVEMCNNNGHCRKFDAGTMCPSYRVTRDEQHLTRGRANTLRLALSGQLGPDAFTSDAVADAMDLCVGCKGCKRDCPTGVDMARMKIEFTAQHKRATATR
jgi:hypothetical protein